MGAYNAGQFVGGIFGIFLLYLLWENLLFRRILDDPVQGKLTSVAAAYVTASTIWGFTTSIDGSFNPNGFVIYLLGAAVIGAYAWRRGVKTREKNAEYEAFD